MFSGPFINYMAYVFNIKLIYASYNRSVFRARNLIQTVQKNYNELLFPDDLMVACIEKAVKCYNERTNRF